MSGTKWSEIRESQAKKVAFRKNVGDLLSSTVPEVSANYIMLANTLSDNQSQSNGECNGSCPWCGTLISTAVHRFRLIPKKKKSRSIQKLEKKVKKGYHLPKSQRKYLHRFQHRTNHLKLSCSVCKKTFNYSGSGASTSSRSLNRSKKSFHQSQTPENFRSRKYTQKNIKLLSSLHSPGMPSASSTPSPSSTKKQKKKWNHSMLQQILNTSQQQSQTAALQDFLSTV